MGQQKLNFTSSLLLSLVLFLIVAFPSFSDGARSSTASSSLPTPARQQQLPEFRVKSGPPPSFLDRGYYKKRKGMKRKPPGNDLRTRPFSAMLPKGFVPPSGSSPCHNDDPVDSVAVYCSLSTTKGYRSRPWGNQITKRICREEIRGFVWWTNLFLFFIRFDVHCYLFFFLDALPFPFRTCSCSHRILVWSTQDGCFVRTFIWSSL